MHSLWVIMEKSVDPLIRSLDHARRRKDWTLAVWAGHAGVHPQTAAKIIRGDVRGSLVVVQKLAWALGLEVHIRHVGGDHD